MCENVKNETCSYDISKEWTNYKLYCLLHKSECTKHKVKKLIKSGADVNCKDHEDRTLLHHIATIPNCNFDAIKFILKSVAEVNARDVENNTPLHVAVRHSENNLSFIHELLQCGSEVNVRNDAGDTPLHLAPGSLCRWNVVKKLVDAGAKVNARNNAGNTPLHIAIKNLRSNTASELVIAGADVNIRNDAGTMPLHLALRLMPQDVIVTELLNAGALINDRDGDGFAPLHLAVARGSSSAINIIKLGAAVFALDYSGHTALTYIEHSISNLGPTLLAAELDIKRKVEASDLSLHSAAKSVDCYSLLMEALSYGIEVNIPDIDGTTPLHHAVRNPLCNVAIVEAFVKRGARVNAVDVEGNCPLHYAVQRTTINVPLIGKLLEHGAKVGLRNRFGDNVLQLALKNRFSDREDLLDCFKLLVKYAILQNEFLSYKFCLELNSKLTELFSYKSECLEERNRMKKCVVLDSVSMFDFVVNRDDCFKKNLVENVFSILLTVSFPIYIDDILLNFEKKYIVEKVLTQKVYAAYGLPFKTNRVMLKYDCVLYLCGFLSKLDLINLFIAYMHSDFTVT